MGADDFRVGDIVFHKSWDLCLWEILDLDGRESVRPSEFNVKASLRLLGGQACPPWGVEIRPSVDWIVRADKKLNAMEILAMSALDCWP